MLASIWFRFLPFYTLLFLDVPHKPTKETPILGATVHNNLPPPFYLSPPHERDWLPQLSLPLQTVSRNSCADSAIGL